MKGGTTRGTTALVYCQLHGSLNTEVGNITSKCNGVTCYRFRYVIRTITIKSDNVSYESRAITIRSENGFYKPRAITINSDNFSLQFSSVMQ